MNHKHASSQDSSSDSTERTRPGARRSPAQLSRGFKPSPIAGGTVASLEGQPLSSGWESKEARPLQMRTGGDSSESMLQGQILQLNGDAEAETASAPQGGGAPLPAPVQAHMESAFGSSFSDVRVHQGSHVSDMGAQAYAQGSDIHFAPGQFNPGSKEGLGLIGHELTHVVQQRQGRVQAPAQAKGLPINSDPGLEREADVMGEKAASFMSGSAPLMGSTTVVGGASPIQANRKEDKPTFKPKINTKADLEKNYGVKSNIGKPKPTTPKIPVNKNSKTDPADALKKTLEKDSGEPKKVPVKDKPKIEDSTPPKEQLENKPDNKPKVNPSGPKNDLVAKEEAQKKAEALKEAARLKAEEDKKAQEEKERQALEDEVRATIRSLQESMLTLSSSLHNDKKLKNERLKPVVSEEMLPTLSTQLFKSAQKDAKKAILEDQGGELEKEFETALTQEIESAKKAGADANDKSAGKAGREWTALKAQKAQQDTKELSKLKGKGKEAMAEEMARQAVEDKLRGDIDSITDITWETSGNEWNKIVTDAEANKGINFKALQAEVIAMKTGDTSRPALEQTKVTLVDQSKKVLEGMTSIGELVSGNFKATALNKLDKVTDKLKDKYDLGWFSDGSEKNQARIKDSASKKAGDQTMRTETAGKKVQVVLQDNFQGFSGKFGALLDSRVENPGDFAGLAVELTIPLGSGFNLLLQFSGEIEKDDEGTTLKMDGKIGASFGLEGVFAIKATFGGYIEAKGANALHALELMSLSFFKRAQGKLPESWLNSIWGLGGKLDPKEAEKWAAYVEEKMQEGHFVESGLLAEVGAEVGDPDKIGGSATLSGKTGTRWSKQKDATGNENLAKQDVNGGKVALAGAFGPLSGSFEAELVRISAENQPKIWDFKLGGEANMDMGVLGDGISKIVDAIIDVLDKANDKLAAKFQESEDGKIALQTPEDKEGLADVLLGKAKDEGLETASVSVGKMLSMKVEEEAEESLLALEPGDLLEGLDHKQAGFTERIMEGVKPLEDGYKDASEKASDAMANVGNKGLDKIGIDENARKGIGEKVDAVKDKASEIQESVGLKAESGESIGIGFEITRKTGEGWGGDLYLKKESKTKISIGVAKVEATKGHKYSVKNNALFKKATGGYKKK